VRAGLFLLKIDDGKFPLKKTATVLQRLPVEEKTGSNLSLIIKSKGHFGYFKYSILDFLEIPFHEGTRFNRRCYVHIVHSELTKVI